MVASRNQAQNVQQDEGDKVLHSFKEWMVQEARANEVTRLTDRKKSSVSDGETSGKGSYFPLGIASQAPSIDRKQRPTIQDIPHSRRSLGGRVFRALVYCCILAVVVGVVWQAYGDGKIKHLADAGVRSLLTWLPSEPKSQDRAAAIAQSGPAPPVANTSPELQQQVETIMSDLAVVRHLVEQLAAKQDQVDQDIATLQTSEQSVSQKISSLAQAIERRRKSVPKPVRSETAAQPAPVTTPAPSPAPPPAPGVPPTQH